MKNDLKKCPFCGGEANLFSKFKINDNTLDENAPNGYSVRCECKVCGAKGKEFISLENPEDIEWDNMACKDAIRAWNVRYSKNSSKQKNNSVFSDIMLKMAIAYTQIEHGDDIKSGKIPSSVITSFEFDKMIGFFETVVDIYKEYNNSKIEETFLDMIEEDNE